MNESQVHTSEKGICDYRNCTGPSQVQFHFDTGFLETCAHHGRSLLSKSFQPWVGAFWIESAEPFDGESMWGPSPMPAPEDDEENEENDGDAEHVEV